MNALLVLFDRTLSWFYPCFSAFCLFLFFHCKLVLYDQQFGVPLRLVVALFSSYPMYSLPKLFLCIHVYYFNLYAEDSYFFPLLKTLLWVSDCYILIFVFDISPGNLKLNIIKDWTQHPILSPSKSDHPPVPQCQWTVPTSISLFKLEN